MIMSSFEGRSTPYLQNAMCMKYISDNGQCPTQYLHKLLK